MSETERHAARAAFTARLAHDAPIDAETALLAFISVALLIRYRIVA
jgi:hypothetical protein